MPLRRTMLLVVLALFALGASDVVYRGNRSSRVFHAPECRNYHCRNCTVEFRSVDEALRAGYRGHVQCVPDVNPTPAAPYSGNVDKHRFHRKGCPYFTCARCTRTFATRDEAITAGYVPCRVCDP